MYKHKEPAITETTEGHETHENHEAPRSVEESPEELRQEMTRESEKAVSGFRSECADDIASAEIRAEKEGTLIEGEDKAELFALSGEADVARAELLSEIGGEIEPALEKSDTEAMVSTVKMAQRKVHEMFQAGQQGSPEYGKLSALLFTLENGVASWKPIGEIDVTEVEEAIEQIGRVEVRKRGMEKIMSLHAAGDTRSQEYLALYAQLTKSNSEGLVSWRDIGEINSGAVAEILDTIEAVVSDPDDEPPLLEPESKPAVVHENVSAMQDRSIQTPELLSAEVASKKFLAEERKKLAEEIREQRRLQRERLAVLKTGIESADADSETHSGEREDVRYGELAESESNEANATADRLSSPAEFSEDDARGERENLVQLIAMSGEMQSLKAKLAEHYAKADEVAKEKFESMRKTVEQTLIRNNAFIVHTFLENEELRHNDNSNISKRATLEDDMNILLSLEPSISTSSVVPGSRQGLWGGRIGVVLGGGDIRGAATMDNGTTTGGIKFRNGNISNFQEIDGIVSDPKDRGYNELVVNNPKTFGLFVNVDVGESGEMRGFNSSTDHRRKELENKKNKDKFMAYVDLATRKGMPALVMTPDRRLFEFVSIGDDGIVEVGAEITPEQVAFGKAGLPDEKKLELGEEVISKNLFNRIRDQKEAKEILTGLKGEGISGVELSREEYLAYAKDNKGGQLYEFPKHLLADKTFMLEVAVSNPAAVYESADETLKEDVDFIRKIYSLENRGIAEDNHSLYQDMPDNLKKNESIALLAIENNDYQQLDSDLADSPVVWGKIIDKMVERENPDRWFSREIGEAQIAKVYFRMKKGYDSVDMSERLMSDTSFLQKLEREYPKYRFEIDEYGQLLITKLA